MVAGSADVAVLEFESGQPVGRTSSTNLVITMAGGQIVSMTEYRWRRWAHRLASVVESEAA